MFQVVQRAVHSLVDKIWKGSSNYVAATGAANTYAVAYVPAFTAYTDGLVVRWKVSATNTGASTLAVNGLAAKSIVKMQGTSFVALAANDLPINTLVETIFDATGDRFILLSRGGNVVDADIVGMGAAKLAAGTVPAGVVVPLARMASATVVNETGATLGNNIGIGNSLGSTDSFYVMAVRATAGEIGLYESGAAQNTADALLTQGAFAYFYTATDSSKVAYIQNSHDANTLTFNRKVYRLQET